VSDARPRPALQRSRSGVASRLESRAQPRAAQPEILRVLKDPDLGGTCTGPAGHLSLLRLSALKSLGRIGLLRRPGMPRVVRRLAAGAGRFHLSGTNGELAANRLDEPLEASGTGKASSVHRLGQAPGPVTRGQLEPKCGDGPRKRLWALPRTWLSLREAGPAQGPSRDTAGDLSG
jgi:hypothetical protein